MGQTTKDILILTAVNILLTLAIWLPFVLRVPSFYGLNFSEGFSSIYRNFDGLNYIIIAKTFYNPDLIAQIPQSLAANYFPAHFPGYPLLIALFSPLLGYLKSMLVVSMIFTIASSIAFYFLVRDFKLSSHPLWLSIVFLIFPARWLIVHSVGSPEPVFIFFTIMTIYFFKHFEDSSKFKFLVATAISAALVQLIRPPGILLFISLMIYLLSKNFSKDKLKALFTLPMRYFPLILAPLTLLGIFTFYQLQLGDFFAYFHSGDNIHLTFPPYQVFNQAQFWVGDIWLEDIVYIFILGFLGGTLLLKTNLQMGGIFVLVYLLATTLVAHRDIARYTLPIFPFLIIAFEKILVCREFKITAAIVILAIYLYAQNFIIQNTAPAPNLEFFN